MEETIWYVLLPDELSMDNPAKLIHLVEEDAVETEKMYADFIDKLMDHPYGAAWCFFFATDEEMSSAGSSGDRQDAQLTG